MCRMEGSRREEGFQRRRDANFLLNSGEFVDLHTPGLGHLKIDSCVHSQGGALQVGWPPLVGEGMSLQANGVDASTDVIFD